LPYQRVYALPQAHITSRGNTESREHDHIVVPQVINKGYLCRVYMTRCGQPPLDLRNRCHSLGPSLTSLSSYPQRPSADRLACFAYCACISACMCSREQKSSFSRPDMMSSTSPGTAGNKSVPCRLAPRDIATFARIEMLRGLFDIFDPC
jgi:hypothetical protein